MLIMYRQKNVLIVVSIYKDKFTHSFLQIKAHFQGEQQ